MKTYSWNAGWCPNADAQIVGEELERIRERDGGITVDVMLEEARPEEAPLHPLCTWDDLVAAENWRKEELRNAARKLLVTTLDHETHHALVHVANPVPGQQGWYQPIDVVVQNIDQYELVFKSALRRIEEAQRAMAELKRVAEANQLASSPRLLAVVKADQALTVASEELAKAS